MANPAPKGWSSLQAIAADNAAKANNALWYTFTGIGRAYLIRIGSPDAGAADIAAVHGYSTIEDAYANPNTVSNAAEITIQQWNNHASLPVGGGTFGTIETVNITAPAKAGAAPSISTPQSPLAASVGNSLDWLSNIADFFSRLSEANTWIRVAEFVLGGALVLVGVAHVAKGTQVGQTAAKVAKTAGLALAL